jgi:hypothetical protein
MFKKYIFSYFRFFLSRVKNSKRPPSDVGVKSIGNKSRPVTPNEKERKKERKKVRKKE